MKQKIVSRNLKIAVAALATLSFFSPAAMAVTYTVDGVGGQGTGWDGTNIIAWDGAAQVTLSSTTNFGSGDVLAVTSASQLVGADFNGWNLSNLTIDGQADFTLRDTKFTGATFSNTVITNSTQARIFRSHTEATGAAFSGDLTGLTLNITENFWREGERSLDGSTFSGAVLNVTGTSFGFVGLTPAPSFAGATINWGGSRTFRGSNISNYDFSGSIFNINQSQLWRESSGALGTDWTNTTINANTGGLFDAANFNTMFTGQTFDFAGSVLSGDIFAGLSAEELAIGGFTLDFTNADVGNIASSPDANSLANFSVLYGPGTVFGTFTESDAIAANWTAIPEPSSASALLGGIALLVGLVRRRR